jgi:signal transduction histidine kinase
MTIDLAISISFGSSILYALIAVLTLRGLNTRQRTKRVSNALAIFALISFLWAAEQAAWQLGWLSFLRPDFLGRLPLYGVFLLGASLLFLTRSFFQRSGSGWGWLLVGSLWMAAMVLLDANFLALPDVLWTGDGWYIPRDVTVAGLLVSGWSLFLLGAAFITWGASRQDELPVYRNAFLYWVLLLVLTISGGSLFFLGYRLIGGTLHLLGALLAAYVVMTIRLPDLRRTVRGLIYFLIVTGLSLAFYAFLFWGIQSLPVFQNISPFLVGLIFAIALVFVLNPFLAQIKDWVERLIPGGVKNPARVLQRYNERITNVLDFQFLATAAVSTASEVLDLRRGFLFLVDHEKEADGKNIFHLRGVNGTGGQNPQPGMLAVGSPLAEYFLEEHKPLTQFDIEHKVHFRDLSGEERLWLESLRTDVYVPIYTKDEWIGLLALGPQFSGPIYSTDSLELLNLLANQTAVAMENVRLVEGLMRLNNEFRRAYQALDQANQHLERLDHTKSDFISVASHELRTPLTVISGSAQILLNEPALQENPYHQKLLSKIQSGTVRLHEVLDSMLVMAKIDARDLKLNPQPVGLQDLFEGLRADLRTVFNEREQTLEVKNLHSLPSIEADREALQTVFSQLIGNAIKYTPDGGKITVSGWEIKPNDEDFPAGGVEILVSDTGVGIDPQFKELIFEKFYQTGELALHSSGKTKFKGSGPGLGLTIARGIVNAHGGKIWVESTGFNEKNCPGSDFHVRLPLKPI